MAAQRLIDLDEAMEATRKEIYWTESRAADVRSFLIQQPRVDAVEVVRCKECKSWEQYNACDGTKPHRCMNHDAIFYKRTAPDDFCSYGERRTDNG